MDLSPSFNTHSCVNAMDIANREGQELHNDSEFKDIICFSDEEVNEAEENTQEDEFEFPLVFTDSSLADNIMNDQITPRYPLFDKSLLLNLDSNSSNTIDSKPAPASTPILAPTTDTVSTVTPTSTIVAASTPATVITPTSTIVADKVSTSVTPTPTTDTISTSVTPAPTTDTLSTHVTPTSTQAPATDTISTIIPTLTPDTASAPAPLTTSTVTPATNPDPASPPPTRLSLGKLFSEDRDSATQSSTLVLESKDFNTISSPQTYCIWKPQEQEHQLPPKQHHSRGKHKKSNSISISEVETSPKRWRVRDLLKRSYSDDSKHTSLSSIFYSPSPKEKIGKDGSVVVFLPPILPKPSNEKVKKPEKALKTTLSMGGRCLNHKPDDKTPAYKTKIGNIRLPAFLPYRQDQHQVDAFANYNNNGPSKHMYR